MGESGSVPPSPLTEVQGLSSSTAQMRAPTSEARCIPSSSHLELGQGPERDGEAQRLETVQLLPSLLEEPALKAGVGSAARRVGGEGSHGLITEVQQRDLGTV